MNSKLTYDEIALKIINVVLMMMLIKLFRMKPNYNENVELDVRDENVETDVRDKNKWYEIAPGRFYKGEWLNDVPHGKGMQEYIGIPGSYENSHTVMIGDFVNGKMKGRGIAIYDRDDDEKMMTFYEGEYDDNKKNGMGKYHYGNGSFYEGEFKNDKYNGTGRFVSTVKRRETISKYVDDSRVETLYVREL